jgi:hypothetical protein
MVYVVRVFRSPYLNTVKGQRKPGYRMVHDMMVWMVSVVTLGSLFALHLISGFYIRVRSCNSGYLGS